MSKQYRVSRNGLVVKRFNTFEEAKAYAPKAFKNSSDDVEIRKDGDSGIHPVERPQKIFGARF